MISRSDIAYTNEVIQGLNTEIIGKNIYHFKTLDSTNLYSKKFIKKGIQEGAVVIADTQTCGRGRKKRSWSSPLGGLWFSVILYPNIHPKQGMFLTMIASVSVAQAIKKCIGINPTIKWPNDIIIKEKKLCGILTELESEKDKIKNAIVGIGINVNNKIDRDLKDVAISLKQVKGIDISLINLLSKILKKFDYYYQQFLTKKYDNIRKTWFSFSEIIGKKVEVYDNNKIINGIVSDVDENGCLILDTPKGKVQIFSGDVKYL